MSHHAKASKLIDEWMEEAKANTPNSMREYDLAFQFGFFRGRAMYEVALLLKRIEELESNQKGGKR